MKDLLIFYMLMGMAYGLSYLNPVLKMSIKRRVYCVAWHWRGTRHIRIGGNAQWAMKIAEMIVDDLKSNGAKEVD